MNTCPIYRVWKSSPKFNPDRCPTSSLNPFLTINRPTSSLLKSCYKLYNLRCRAGDVYVCSDLAPSPVNTG